MAAPLSASSPYSTLPSSFWQGLNNQQGYGGLATAGTALQIGGAVTSAIGAFSAADLGRESLKSQALSMEFEASMSAINARAAEKDAAAILEAGQQETLMLDLGNAARKAADKASFASRGVAVGAGSAAEIAASSEFAHQLDRRSIRLNAVRAANDARVNATNQRIQGSIASVSARNLRATARSINPWMSASGGLLSGVGAAASAYANDHRYYPRR